MSRMKEIAKFVCGVEAFHAFVHGYFWFSDTTLMVLGITQTPTINFVGAVVNAAISLILGIYAWGPHGRRAA